MIILAMMADIMRKLKGIPKKKHRRWLSIELSSELCIDGKDISYSLNELSYVRYLLTLSIFHMECFKWTISLARLPIFAGIILAG